MIYVQRDGNGAIKGVYANPQPQPDGTCLTDPHPLDENDPEVRAFLAPKQSKAGISDGELAAILVQQKVIPQSVIDDAVNAQEVTASKV